MTMNRIVGMVLTGAMLLVAPVWGQKNEIRQLQRDVAILQDEMRMQMKDQADRMVGLESMLKTMLDQINATNRAVTVLDNSLRGRIDEGMAKPMANVGSKVDAMSEDYRYVRETVAEINSRLNRLSTQVSDLDNALRMMQAPPPPPGGAPGMAPSATAAPAGVTAKQVYDDALRDKTGGNFDLSLRQFNDFLTWFPTSDLAPNAQYYVGEVFFAQKQYEAALQAFDAVLERYPQNAKTNDARFMKGRTLVEMGDRNAGADEFRGLISEAPNSDAARQARTQLQRLGLRVAPAKSPARKR
jgi:tol-pal system protein YbgF